MKTLCNNIKLRWPLLNAESGSDAGVDAPPSKRARELASLVQSLNSIVRKEPILGKVVADLDRLPEFNMPKTKTRKPLLKELWNTECGEIYSKPRVTTIIAEMGQRPAWALDLTAEDPLDDQPWEFNVKEKRQSAKQLLDTDKPPAHRVSDAWTVQ